MNKKKVSLTTIIGLLVILTTTYFILNESKVSKDPIQDNGVIEGEVDKILLKETENSLHFIIDGGVYFSITHNRPGKYRKYVKLEGLNPKTTSFENQWAIDNSIAYYGNEIIENIDIDSLEFIPGLETSLVKDRNSVYGLTGFHYSTRDQAFSIIKDADPKTVVHIDARFFKDRNSIYYYSIARMTPLTFHKLEGADVETFEVLRGFENYSPAPFSKDKNNVYYSSHKAVVIKDADPSTFEILEDAKWSKDNNSYFYYEKEVDADYDTFVYSIDNSGFFDFSKDKDYVFFEGKIIDDIDVKSLYFENMDEYGNPTIVSDSNTKYRIYSGDPLLEGNWLERI